ncbi:MogA/MoaB family molybdenum cofactor biosynthesis protein [Halobacterium jilantaiense]|uniref:Molybdenum cofactor biosynthesis protein B n=1 Tax=Halobacterium jilantaiense TaxID=355548 RepID=A0A1I0QHP6_9EURY|nr:molybdenum cofactor biosynthesis protein B [Halobacterium jilantaiense]SEW26149.1 molybdenum cofactor biosynthesis protein B [Halobacterium jilantaiense]
MVDFQSRDTRRSSDEDDEPPDAPDEAESADDSHDEEDTHHDDEETHTDHDHHDHDAAAVGAAVLTVSSTRSLDDDPGGDAIVDALEADGHEVVTRELVTDSYDRVQGALDNLLGRNDVDVVVTTGGTGVTPDDVTVDAARPLFDRELPGFGELFRRLSFEDIGTKVVGSRATAGVVEGTLVFCLPGSERATRLGTEDVILPELPHLVGLANR